MLQNFNFEVFPQTLFVGVNVGDGGSWRRFRPILGAQFLLEVGGERFVGDMLLKLICRSLAFQ